MGSTNPTGKVKITTPDGKTAWRGAKRGLVLDNQGNPVSRTLNDFTTSHKVHSAKEGYKSNTAPDAPDLEDEQE